jgi:hypothetical protein
VQQIEHLVEPAEVELAGRRLEARPAEDADGHEVDARADHELGILAPDLTGPLLGVVVAAEAEAELAGELAEGVDAARVQGGGHGAGNLFAEFRRGRCRRMRSGRVTFEALQHRDHILRL